tara:strand:+ start:185 stop:700 length:516 start_codon:yes stop_codon:yes gene_type:complete
MTFSEKDIITYDNFLSAEDFKSVSDYLKRPKWKWGHGSFSEGGYEFWIMDLMTEYFFTNKLLNIIIEKTGQDYFLSRCYCNGHTYGTAGTFHQDCLDSDGRTVLLYANDTWKQQWGGKTVFDIDGKYHYNEFVSNSIVIFPGVIPHRAETTTRDFTGLRKTVAWKLKLKAS